MKYKMKLTREEKAILAGSRGETMARILETIVEFGEIFGATHLVPVKARGHLVTSFGLGMLKSAYAMLDEIIDAGLKAEAGFTVDPRPYFDDIKCNPLERLIFRKMIYSKQRQYEKQLAELGLVNSNAFTCACYHDEVGNVPQKGEYLSWAESSAVVYANSVIGARCNRNSGVLELFGSIAGKVPFFGLLTDEGRIASWIVEVATKDIPEAQVLGSAIGMKVMEDVPYITGLDRYLGRELTPDVRAYLKDMGAATASNGAVGLYHVENLTPEAREKGKKLVKRSPQRYVIDDAELERVMNSYPNLWRKKNAKPRLCFIGCPHLSFHQLVKWNDRLDQALKAAGRKKVKVKTVMCSAPDVLEKFKTTDAYRGLVSKGVLLSATCPLMYTSNPLSSMKPIMTNSNKLRTYSAARYFTDKKILDILSGKEAI